MAAYGVLLKRARQAIARGKQRARDAVEVELVRTKWEVGKLILDHILLNKERAAYGKQVFKRLAKDLTTSETELKYMVEYARSHPIRPPAGELDWAKQRELLTVNSRKERTALARRAARQKWSRQTLRREIKKLSTAKPIVDEEAARAEPLVPIKGKPGTYRIVTAKAGPWIGRRAVDLGFSNYYVPAEPLAFDDREIVQVSEDTRLAPAKAATPADLFTYRAYVLEVTDGDTFWALIDVGFGFVTHQHLRLRGLDAPEITTRGGQSAKRFVERQLKSASGVVVTSTRSDKYDRYLADVFYTKAGKEYFLNHELLRRGFAAAAMP